MYSKIALGNVRKSFKDYAIYFLTLTFAVCIFYCFNSIESQKAVLDMSASQAGYMESINQLLSMVSVFVVFILGGLILYANNFLIKKRKKELGVYMTLGMGKSKISKILVLETFIVGILSLVVGLGVGILLSQGLSVFTAKLFEVGMTQFRFVISFSAIIKTIIYFGLIFLFVMFFNTIIISKYKLIDLLNASKKSETIKVKNPILSLLIFLVAVIMLITAYGIVLKVGLNEMSSLFNLSIVLGIIGTLGFFYGGAGFLLAMIQRSQNIYLKKLNIFVVRQIHSNINTNFLSVSLICLMLFITIGGLSTGLSMKTSIENGIVAPFDASAYMYVDDEDEIKTMQQVVEKLNFDFKGNEHMFFEAYRLEGISTGDLILPYVTGTLKDQLENGYWNSINAIKISDYNKIQHLLGKDSITLNDHQILVTSNFSKFLEPLKVYLKNNSEIKINGETFEIKNKDVMTDATYNSALADNILTLIVPDKVVSSLEPTMTYMNIQYTAQDKVEAESYFGDYLNSFFEEGSKDGIFLIGYTKQQIYENSRATSTVVLYVGLYLGIVFLLSSAAVLALQQLSEASDSIERYKSLRKIGATQKMINKTIFIQTLIYFALPLVLGMIHAVFGIYVVNKDLTSLYGQSDILVSSIMTMMGIIVIYGGYFLTTYVGYKSIIKNAK
ncbi:MULTISPECIES: ABC transporter permease [Turicibacter]|uniref:ABC transporter permease n=1 Tax=Turicibacter TaxID=191303 RepID=UPI0001FDAFCD|nr:MULTISPECIES: ABC transporter permease [Turicibacter]EGC92513.1 efflux ABC transporter, permease protein [Turicibacter sp. HGF1]MCU7196841.1 ABC transporter permease [Turicibacter sanguinis]MCU7201072.1 ABC transporter permease [Turicibacter sanguinis]MDB8558377.1 ABC transporter permease [Turicibacter sanguinis]MDB8561063.1 ABC transporter permease [Turicibacter sanguinis]